MKYARNKIFGTIGIDTLQEKVKINTFVENELAFYQVGEDDEKVLFFYIYFLQINYLKKKGVANTFAKSYANIIFKNRLIKTCISAVEWLSHRFASEVFNKIFQFKV